MPTPDDQQPHSLSPAALAYVTRHADEINRIAVATGASGSAIALSVGRELTRNDLVGSVHRFGHSLAEQHALDVGSDRLEAEYAAARTTLKADPKAFDGNHGVLKQFQDPILADVGPGHVKILTAFELIDRNADSEMGRQLGLDRYRHDRAAIVRDLEDPNNALSLKIAGLMVRDGQAYLGRQQIEGRSWNELDGRQKDAALVSYYTLGESAVATRIAAGDFRPSTGGASGGWVMHKTNRADVLGILEAKACLVADSGPRPRGTDLLTSIEHEAEQRALWMASAAGPNPTAAAPAVAVGIAPQVATRGLTR